MPLNNFHAETDKMFDEKVNELRRDLGTEKVYEFGYKTIKGNEMFTVPDWGNIKAFLHQRTEDLLAALREEVMDIKSRFALPHSRGSHADDFNDTEPCDCTAERDRGINRVFSQVLELLNSAGDNSKK